VWLQIILSLAIAEIINYCLTASHFELVHIPEAVCRQLGPARYHINCSRFVNNWSEVSCITAEWRCKIAQFETGEEWGVVLAYRTSHSALILQYNSCSEDTQIKPISQQQEGDSVCGETDIRHAFIWLTNAMELSPSREAVSCAANSRTSQHFIEPESSLPCPQKSCTGLNLQSFKYDNLFHIPRHNHLLNFSWTSSR
jgi:hypothetical protein